MCTTAERGGGACLCARLGSDFSCDSWTFCNKLLAEFKLKKRCTRNTRITFTSSHFLFLLGPGRPLGILRASG